MKLHGHSTANPGQLPPAAAAAACGCRHSASTKTCTGTRQQLQHHTNPTTVPNATVPKVRQCCHHSNTATQSIPAEHCHSCQCSQSPHARMSYKCTRFYLKQSCPPAQNMLHTGTGSCRTVPSLSAAPTRSIVITSAQSTQAPFVHTDVHAHYCMSVMKCMHKGASCTHYCACTSRYVCDNMHAQRCLMHSQLCMHATVPSSQLRTSILTAVLLAHKCAASM